MSHTLNFCRSNHFETKPFIGLPLWIAYQPYLVLCLSSIQSLLKLYFLHERFWPLEDIFMHDEQAGAVTACSDSWSHRIKELHRVPKILHSLDWSILLTQTQIIHRTMLIPVFKLYSNFLQETELHRNQYQSLHASEDQKSAVVVEEAEIFNLWLHRDCVIMFIVFSDREIYQNF